MKTRCLLLGNFQITSEAAYQMEATPNIQFKSLRGITPCYSDYENIINTILNKTDLVIVNDEMVSNPLIFQALRLDIPVFAVGSNYLNVDFHITNTFKTLDEAIDYYKTYYLFWG